MQLAQDRRSSSRSCVRKEIHMSKPIATIPLALVRKRRPLFRFLRDQRGAGMVEYIILAGMIAVAGIIVFKNFGQKVKDKVKKQTTAVGQVVDTPSN
jgi:Flp pilus assembly pilin Flp